MTSTGIRFSHKGTTFTLYFANIERVDHPKITMVNIGGETIATHAREQSIYTAKGIFSRKDLEKLRALSISPGIKYSPTGKPEDDIAAVITESKITEPSQSHLSVTAEITFKSKKIVDHYYTATAPTDIAPPDIFHPGDNPAPFPGNDFGEGEEPTLERIFDSTFDSTFQ